MADGGGTQWKGQDRREATSKEDTEETMIEVERLKGRQLRIYLLSTA